MPAEIDLEQPRLRVDDDTGTVVVPLGDAGDRIGHVEIDHDEGRRQPVATPIVVVYETGRGGLWRLGHAYCPKRLAGPYAEAVIPPAVVGRIPAPVHADGAQPAAARLVEGVETNGELLAVLEGLDQPAEIGQGGHGPAIDLRYHRRTRYPGTGEYVAGTRQVDAPRRDVQVTCLLV